MKFISTQMAGVYLLESNGHSDKRGIFSRLYCPIEFKRANIDFMPAQISISTNTECHTLRGMHYSAPPRAEKKLITVVRGSAFDVAVDLRTESTTYRQWIGWELNDKEIKGVLLPEGVAHGYITLEPNTSLLYQINKVHTPNSGKGVLWNDPEIGISWPADPAVISGQDMSWQLLASL